jgi:hypothetical protein
MPIILANGKPPFQGFYPSDLSNLLSIIVIGQLIRLGDAILLARMVVGGTGKLKLKSREIKWELFPIIG